MKKSLILIITYILTTALTFAQTESFHETFVAEKQYLRLPVKNGAPTKTVEIESEGETLRWFTIELADGEADWYAYLDISAWKGETLSLHVNELDKGSKVFQPIVQTNDDKNDGVLYEEKLRGQFHFSPKRGWNNDPNGLAFYNGEYHLFFQHNPYGRGWGNMHWGHAVSKDLVHWEEIDIALYPDKFGTMFSGGGVVDSNNSSGLGENGQAPLILFYTAAENSWKQGLAYSVDGRNFKKLPEPVLNKISDGNRDPKVIWHEPSKRWVMVLYVTEANELHTMYFFTSTDMKHWEFASKYSGGYGNDRYMYECPEFFELPVEGDPSLKKWVLTGANSQYAIGTFDGKNFAPEEERLFSQHGRDYYAAQTISDEPKGRRIEIGWWRTHTDRDGMNFNQGMSIPTELTLKKTENGLRLFRKPIEELKTLRAGSYQTSSVKLTPNSNNPLSKHKNETAEIRMTIDPKTANNMQINLRDLALNYQINDEEIIIDGVRTHAPLVNGKQEFIIFVDRTGVEIFASGGQVFIPVNYNFAPSNTSYDINVTGGDAVIETLEFHKLKSIW